MLPVHKDLGKVRGHELLYFENAELEKVKGNFTSFATFGALSVLYFKDYNRCVLMLNDWKYPLLRRLPVLGEDNQDTGSRTYHFPAPNGFAYNLKITQPNGNFAFQNLDTVLEHNSRLCWKNNDQPFRKAEQSPDDHLNRYLKKESATGKETIGESIKQGIQNLKIMMKPGTKNLTSRKKKINQKDIKTKDFRKESRSRLGKSFFKDGQKFSHEFWRLRLVNLNNITVKKYEDIRGHSEGPSFYILREELEEFILKNKDIGAQGLSSFHFALKKEDSTNMFESTWSEVSTQPSSITQSIMGQGPMEAHSRRESIQDKPLAKQPEHEIHMDKLIEGLTHYQG